METENNKIPLQTDAFIEGDLFDGLAISVYEDKDYSFTKNGNQITVSQRTVRSSTDCLTLGFLFLMDKPERFRMDVFIPDDCYNANCSLNGKELIGYFSKELPPDPAQVTAGSCGGASHEKYSTLKPGSFQSINFRWESGDVLKFFFYFHEDQK